MERCQCAEREIRCYLKAARTELESAEQILSAVMHSERQAAVHLLNGWRSLITAKQVFAGDGSLSLEDVPVNAAESCKAIPPMLSKKELENELKLMLKCVGEASWEPLDQLMPGAERFDAHTQALRWAVCGFSREMRKEFGKPILSYKPIRWGIWATVVVIVAALIGYALFSVFRPVPPWRAALYDNPRFQGAPREMQRHEEVDFVWGMESPGAGIPADGFSIRWDTCLTIEDDSEIRFMLSSDDGSRLLVDDKTVIDNWGDHAERSVEHAVKLARGVHHLVVEYYDAAFYAAVHLAAKDESNRDIFPVSNLSAPGADGSCK